MPVTLLWIMLSVSSFTVSCPLAYECMKLPDFELTPNIDSSSSVVLSTYSDSRFQVQSHLTFCLVNLLIAEARC